MQHTEVLQLTKAALDDYPDSLNLLVCCMWLCMLSYKVKGQTCASDDQKYAVTVEALNEDQTDVEISEQSEKWNDTRSVFPKYQTMILVPYTSILFQHHMLRKHYQKWLLHSVFSLIAQATACLVIITSVWLLLAEIFLLMGHTNEATHCFQEAPSFQLSA